MTQKQTVRTIAVLLFLSVISQIIYTALFKGAPEFNARFIWALEGALFVLLTAFAGSALARSQDLSLGFSAIVFSAMLNIVQIGIGYTQFSPFRAAAGEIEALGPVAFSVISLSFFLYNAAKMLIGLAAMVFGLALLRSGNKMLGGAAIAVGVIALIANALVMMLGLRGLLPSPVAGGSGVLATLLLSLCLYKIQAEKEA